MDSNQLDAKIQEFEGRVAGTPTTARDGQFWRDTWALVKEIDSEFKTVRYATEADKNAALKRFQSLVDQIRTEQKRAGKKHKSEANASSLLRARIINMAWAAWPRQEGFGAMVKDLTGIVFDETAGSLALEKVKTPPLRPDTDPREREKRRLMELSERLNGARAVFNERKADLLPKAQEGCLKILETVQIELNNALDQWKAETVKLKQQRTATFEQRREEKLRLIAEMQSLVKNAAEKGVQERSKAIMAEWKKVGSAGMDYEDDLWASFKSALNAFKLASKHTRDQKLQDRLNNQEAFLEKMLQSMEHDRGVLKEKQLKFANVYDSPQADEIRAHLKTVIESLQQKIQSKKLKVQELQSEIREIRYSLSDVE